MNHLKGVIIIITYLFIISLCSAQEYDYKTALIIGNTNYKVGKLRNPVNDAKLLSSTLSNLGFDVISKLDTDIDELKSAVREFQRKVINNKGIALFYYSGHGIQIEGTNYLVPVNANIEYEYEVESECMDASRILRMLEYVDNPLNIVILDACRNNPFAKSYRSNQEGLASPTTAPSGSIIAFSTAPNKVASDGTGQNGLYTQELVKAITTPDLSIEEVFKYTRRNVAALSNEQQIPWENSSLLGDFYFNKSKKVTNKRSDEVSGINNSAIKEPLISINSNSKDFESAIGNYKTIEINDDFWLQSNLNVDRFSDGSIITYAASESAWINAWKNKQPAWAYADESKKERVYNWYAAADPRGVCPKGWKVPTVSDWKKMLSKYKGKVFKHYFKNTPAFYYKGNESMDFLGLEDWLIIGNDGLKMKVKPSGALNTNYENGFEGFPKMQSAHFWTSDSVTRTSIWPNNPLIFVKDGGLTNAILPNKYADKSQTAALSFSISQVNQIDVQTTMLIEPAEVGYGFCIRCIQEED